MSRRSSKVRVTERVPVRQNKQSISAAVLAIVDGVVLKKYDTVDSSGQSTPPVSASLTLTHLAVAGAPDFHVDTLTPQQLMLPVRDREASVPAMRAWASIVLCMLILAIALARILRAGISSSR